MAPFSLKGPYFSVPVALFLYRKCIGKQSPFGKWHQNGPPKGPVLRTAILVPLIQQFNKVNNQAWFIMVLSLPYHLAHCLLLHNRVSNFSLTHKDLVVLFRMLCYSRQEVNLQRDYLFTTGILLII